MIGVVRRKNEGTWRSPLCYSMTRKWLLWRIASTFCSSLPTEIMKSNLLHEQWVITLARFITYTKRSLCNECNDIKKISRIYLFFFLIVHASAIRSRSIKQYTSIYPRQLATTDDVSHTSRQIPTDLSSSGKKGRQHSILKPPSQWPHSPPPPHPAATYQTTKTPTTGAVGATTRTKTRLPTAARVADMCFVRIVWRKRFLSGSRMSFLNPEYGEGYWVLDEGWEERRVEGGRRTWD